MLSLKSIWTKEKLKKRFNDECMDKIRLKNKIKIKGAWITVKQDSIFEQRSERKGQMYLNTCMDMYVKELQQNQPTAEEA